MLATSAVTSLPKLPPVRRGGHCSEENVTRSKQPRGLQVVNNSVSLTRFPFGTRTHSTQRAGAAVICAAALNARCGAEQTQTVLRESPTITHIPGKEKEKSPDLDDGGTGLPPRDDDGGGGGGGGGGNWSGGFFFFGFLAFLGFIKDKESEDTYKDSRRR